MSENMENLDRVAVQLRAFYEGKGWNILRKEKPKGLGRT